MPGKLDKPAGTKLTLEATGRAEGQTIRCERMVLAMGEAAEGRPAALVRGLDWSAPVRPASALIRPRPEDLFR